MRENGTIQRQQFQRCVLCCCCFVVVAVRDGRAGGVDGGSEMEMRPLLHKRGNNAMCVRDV